MNSVNYVLRKLTTEANKAKRECNNPRGERASVYYSGLESGLRRAIELLRGEQRKVAKKRRKKMIV